MILTIQLHGIIKNLLIKKFKSREITCRNELKSNKKKLKNIIKKFIEGFHRRIKV